MIPVRSDFFQAIPADAWGFPAEFAGHRKMPGDDAKIPERRRFCLKTPRKPSNTTPKIYGQE